jgi:hypothetical protein
MLRDDTRRELLDHEDKAQLIWVCFKERLVISEFNEIDFYLASLIHPMENLDWLEGEFLKKK